jgi:hypothetical protein
VRRHGRCARVLGRGVSGGGGVQRRSRGRAVALGREREKILFNEALFPS